jgi:AcrR family transcriptional regulator
VDLKSRRRGAELEGAILDAAWWQLMEKGWSDFTFESIAARAGTSRPVLYRRWADRSELLKAAITHAGMLSPIQVPDTGSLRGDAITILRRANEARAGYVALLSAQLADYFRETGTSLADLRDLVRARPRNGLEQIIDRAEERGEVHPSRLTPRLIELPMSLMRHEMLMTLKRVPDEVIDEIVDEIWLPLLRASGALPAARA